MTIYGKKPNTFQIKKGDTSPRIETILLDANGPTDLTNATAVKFSMRMSRNPRTVVLNEVAAGYAADTNGVVYYDWQPTDTGTPGDYDIEWTVIYPGGKRATFPSDDFDRVEINDSI
jgi:hypothetical protein